MNAPTPEQMRKLDAWIWKTIFKGRIISKRFSLKRTGFKLQDESGEFPNGNGLHGWGWQGSREAAAWHIPAYTTDPTAAMQVLEKCAEKSGEILVGQLQSGQWAVAKHGKAFAEAPTLPLAICIFARKLFEK